MFFVLAFLPVSQAFPHGFLPHTADWKYIVSVMLEKTGLTWGHNQLRPTSCFITICYMTMKQTINTTIADSATTTGYYWFEAGMKPLIKNVISLLSQEEVQRSDVIMEACLGGYISPLKMSSAQP